MYLLQIIHNNSDNWKKLTFLFGSSRNSFSSWFHSSLAFSTGLYCRASSRRISASPRWRQSSKSLPLIRPWSAVTGPSRTCRSYRRCLNERMLLHLYSNGLLPKHQSAYRRSHSTETALLKVTSDQGRLSPLELWKPTPLPPSPPSAEPPLDVPRGDHGIIIITGVLCALNTEFQSTAVA